MKESLVSTPVAVLAVLLTVLAALFAANRSPFGKKLFGIVPLIVFAYFIPTALSNTGVIPLESEAYTFLKKTLLPCSLVLLVLSVDVKAILRLGRPAVILFLTATLTIVIGGPIAYFCLRGLIPAEVGDQAWRGLAALSGSWIGGGANFVAIGTSVEASDDIMAAMVIVDVAVANVWMAILLFMAGREKALDARIGADRSSVDEVRKRVEAFQAEVAKPTSLPDLLVMLAIAFGTTVVATALAKELPTLGDIVKEFTWIVIIVTAVAVALSFTRLRRLEGAGASAMGSVFLYLLVASIGAHAQVSEMLKAPGLVAVGALWMFIHAVVLLIVRRILRAPIFFAAVGSQANVGGAASAPIVAAAFHPALAPVGILLAVGGYVLGTYAALLCAQLLSIVHNM